jgi:cold shock CspA family protein
MSCKGKYVGCVKWFNNKSGFGFVTVISESEFKSKDIFAHHTAINVKGDMYKYLVQGEYVEFDIEKMENRDHEHQAVNIVGILGNDVMCETRHKNRDTLRIKDKEPHTNTHTNRRPRNANTSSVDSR